MGKGRRYGWPPPGQLIVVSLVETYQDKIWDCKVINVVYTGVQLSGYLGRNSK